MKWQESQWNSLAAKNDSADGWRVKDRRKLTTWTEAGRRGEGGIGG